MTTYRVYTVPGANPSAVADALCAGREASWRNAVPGASDAPGIVFIDTDDDLAPVLEDDARVESYRADYYSDPLLDRFDEEIENTPCKVCGSTETPLHVDRVCGNCYRDSSRDDTRTRF